MRDITNAWTAAPDSRAVTYAIYGSFEKRAGANNKNFGNRPGI